MVLPGRATRAETAPRDRRPRRRRPQPRTGPARGPPGPPYAQTGERRHTPIWVVSPKIGVKESSLVPDVSPSAHRISASNAAGPDRDGGAFHRLAHRVPRSRPRYRRARCGRNCRRLPQWTPHRRPHHRRHVRARSGGRAERSSLPTDELIYSPLLPRLPPGRRAAVRDTVPQVRGGRCRSSAARAKCGSHNGFHPPSACAARKQVDDALRRFVHTPHGAPTVLTY